MPEKYEKASSTELRVIRTEEEVMPLAQLKEKQRELEEQLATHDSIAATEREKILEALSRNQARITQGEQLGIT